jgi:ankyrin repeat protein
MQQESVSILDHIELHPEALAKEDNERQQPLHVLLRNESSSFEDALMMMEKYPEALQHQDIDGYLPLHIECENQCRSSIISKCIGLNPKSMAIADEEGNLPLHSLLRNMSSTIEDVLMVIENYPASLKYHSSDGYLPLHIESRHQCRSILIAKLIELYPESLTIADKKGCLPLHEALKNESSSSGIDVALIMIDKYSAALQHQNIDGYLPLHIECRRQCRLPLITKFIELYPESLATVDQGGCLPLHAVLKNETSTVDVALMMIEKYPAAIQHQNNEGYLSLHIECRRQFRSSVMSKFIELYPESLAI